MQISADQGALLTLLTRLVGARQAVEVGTFTGFSSICIARGLADGGHLLCCDVSEEWTAIAREAWVAAGVDDRIELRIAPAIETLRALPTEPTIDLVFIDADKGGLRRLLRRAAAPGPADGAAARRQHAVVRARSSTRHRPTTTPMAIRAFNDKVAADDRVESYLLPIGDGLTLIRKH